jgi:short subunit dehydrogenase-like uncharacterized protein
MSGLLLYGANGYTGELIAREAARRGLAPVLAGRRAEALEPLARELGLEPRAFALENPEAVAAALDGVRVVLHAAGPFVRTSRTMVDACLARGAHYLDITGEIGVFEPILGRDGEAKRAGVALVPGVGFDVVPSDALAAALHEALPGADRLDLAFAGSSGASSSRGTLVTMLEGLPRIGWERRAGRLVPVPAAAATLDIEFPGLGRRRVVQIPWGDLATAWRTTGIPNLRTFAAMPPRTIRLLRWARPLLPLAGLGPIKRALQARVRRTVTGPSPEVRARARMHLWGRVTAPDGGNRARTLSVPEGYAFTALAAVEAARRALAGELDPGAWTPTLGFGRGLLDAIPGVQWDSEARIDRSTTSASQ